MDRTSTRNPYALLALFLSPCKDGKVISFLQKAAVNGQIDWGALLYLANLHLATPLWYVRLAQDGLLQSLPEDLQLYLQQLYLANRQRNTILLRELQRILAAFGENEIDCILLKGAAVFCDDLYGDPGARLMQDLDLMVAENQKDKARRVLLELGYRVPPQPEMDFDGLPTDERHHHLPTFFLPDSSVLVEIHFKVAYGQAGRILTADTAWRGKLPVALGPHNAYLLNQTTRVLHNIVHALLPHCEMIRSEISLLQLAEFVHLSKKYSDGIDWPRILASSAREGFAGALQTYLLLANRLMSMPLPNGMSTGICPLLQTWRHIAAGKYLNRVPKTKYTPGERLGKSLTVPLIKAYYYASLPRWTWRNVCYAEGMKSLPLRVRFLARKITDARSRSRIAR